jgi:hypothetical protein
VHGLWTPCQAKIFFDAIRHNSPRTHARGAASHRASLARIATLTKIVIAHARARLTPGQTVDAVRFNQTINGRPYVIEVSPVGRGRWRAQLARRPNRTTALMPFYGPTPDEAAKRLAVWLARAVRVAS